MSPQPFLTAEWRSLAMLNYEVDPAVLRPLVPRGTELDTFRGKTYASVVAFLFRDTRVLGIPIPFHRHFEEVNLRFYVKRDVDAETRRGVCFVKEIVPRAAIAFVARALYNENYVSLPLSHSLAPNAAGSAASYTWRFQGRDHGLRLSTEEPPAAMRAGFAEEYIAEHHHGYVAQRDGGTLEYRVEHPPWRVAAARDARLDCDVASLYGPAFAPFLGTLPASAFLAEGSPIAVHRGVRIA